VGQLTEIVIDSLHPASLARFWSQVLDDYAVRPYDTAEIERLKSRGFTPETDPAVALDGPGPTLFFQQTDAPKLDRNRVHLDITSTDGARDISRWCALGACVRDEHGDHQVLLDPEGNEFCVKIL
jgi:hypothetical protein